MLIYCFKVALEYDKRIYRTIEIKATQTLAVLHEAIFSAFDRYDDHLYSFFLTKIPVKNERNRFKFPEYTSPYAMGNDAFYSGAKKQNALNAKVEGLDLEPKNKLYYLFDFGDSWWHEITLLSVQEKDTSDSYPQIIKTIGESPAQYPDYDDEDDEEYDE